MKIIKLGVKLEFESPTILNEWKGNTLRGALGHSLRELICLYPKSPKCNYCKAKLSCPYSYLFNFKPTKELQPLWKATGLTKPYTLNPPITTKNVFKPGEELTFSINLFGEATQHANTVIEAIKNINSIGKNKSAGYGKIKEVNTWFEDENQQKYDYPKNLWKNATKLTKIRINFKTPTILIIDRGYQTNPSPADILKASAIKLSSMQTYHGDGPLNWNWKQVFTSFENSETITNELTPSIITRWPHYSKKQQDYPAFTGSLDIGLEKVDEKEKANQALWFGTLSHIGKLSSTGAGEYTINAINNN